MFYLSYVSAIWETLAIIVPVLLSVAYSTVAERKTMASMQRRVGPNFVGYYGLLQAFADALKLLLKEYVSPTQANLITFFLGPIITLIFSFLAYLVIPFAPGITISDYSLGILVILAVSSLATYGILLAGWSANSKYAFLGSLRSTAQLISYELVISASVLTILMVAGNLNLTVIVEVQKSVWYISPLFPIFVIFLIAAIAETNRAPFDLAEAESELVSGFMTEHSAAIFVFFFLAEYASMLVMCLLITIIFLAGFNFDYVFFIYYYIEQLFVYLSNLSLINIVNNSVNPFIEYILGGLILSIKTAILLFTFIWIRASFPRIRYDQLMGFFWKVLLPVVFAIIFMVPAIMYLMAMYTSDNLYF